MPDDFAGVAVTASGRVFSGWSGELRQTAKVGEERVLAERNRRDELIAASERAVQAEQLRARSGRSGGGKVAELDAAARAGDRRPPRRGRRTRRGRASSSGGWRPRSSAGVRRPTRARARTAALRSRRSCAPSRRSSNGPSASAPSATRRSRGCRPRSRAISSWRRRSRRSTVSSAELAAAIAECKAAFDAGAGA